MENKKEEEQKKSVKHELMMDNIYQWFLKGWCSSLPATDNINEIAIIRVRFPTLHLTNQTSSTKVSVVFAKDPEKLPQKDLLDVFCARQCAIAFSYLQQDEVLKKKKILFFAWEQFDCLPIMLLWDHAETFGALVKKKAEGGEGDRSGWVDRFHASSPSKIIDSFCQYCQPLNIWEKKIKKWTVRREEFGPPLYDILSKLIDLPKQIGGGIEEYLQSLCAEHLDCFLMFSDKHVIGACIVQCTFSKKVKEENRIVHLSFDKECSKEDQQRTQGLLDPLLNQFCQVFGISLKT
jgi:hypothetical protein